LNIIADFIDYVDASGLKYKMPQSIE